MRMRLPSTAVAVTLASIGDTTAATHRAIPGRLVAAGGLVLTWLLAAQVPALAALACLVAVLALLIAYKTIAYAEHRRELHQH
jgi:hypothetical protein